MQSRNQIPQFVLALILIASSAILSFSPLLRPWALRAWPAVFAGGLLAVLLHALRRGGGGAAVRSPFGQRLPALLALLALLAAGFTQVLAASGLPSGLLPLHSLPGREPLYLLIGFTAAGGLTWLHLGEKTRAPGAAALAAAGLYASVIFFRVGAVPEVGYAFSLLAGFALLALLSLPGAALFVSRVEAAFWKWALAFAAAQVIALALSPVPGQSLVYVLTLLAALGMSGLLSVYLKNTPYWRSAAWVVLVLGAGLPVLLAVIKAAAVLVDFGPPAALAYRLHPSEMGGANLIARSLLVTAPLGAALFSSVRPDRRWLKAVLLGLQVLILAVIAYARSFEGFFAWLAALGVFGILAAWETIRAAARRLLSTPGRRLGLAGAAVLLLVAGLYAAVQVGYEINPYSFSGRFHHWVGAIDAWQQHPLFGGGQDNEYLYAQSSDRLTMVGSAQQFVDDPLYVIRYRFGLLMVHAHNLLLETAAFSGLAGLVTLVGLLAALLWAGLRAWRGAGPGLKLLAAACLAGIAGELAWGLLDVIREAAPFFSFPIWALVGMLLAAGARPQEEAVRTVNLELRPWAQRLAVAAALVLVLLPALFAGRYGAGFLAFQEQRWEDAGRAFRQAAALNPLSAQSYWMLSRVELELGRWDAAAASLERAAALKRGYSPYLAQAGWLAWLRGDLQAAERYFQAAVDADPLESWTYGLNANLGLLRVHQGRPEEARTFFARSLELHPDLAAAPYWVKASREDGSLHVVLAGDYSPQGNPAELQRRIYAHLGMAGITAQHLNPDAGAGEPLTLESVLDSLHAAYRSALDGGSPHAHLILAAEAEAARLAGLYERAEAAYREYQALRPESAFGYRDLALVYTAQGRLEEAQAWLEQAVQVSPRNIVNLRLLSDARLARRDVEGAGQALEQAAALAAGNAFQLRFFDADLMNALAAFYHASGQADLEREILRRLAITRGMPEQYLALAEVDRAQQRGDLALESCWQAYDLLVQRWVRPYDPRLWAAAECAAAAEQPLEQVGRRAGSGFTGLLFQGHTARLRGQPEAAEAAYRQAAALRDDEGAPYYHLGELYRSQGRVEEAVEALNRAAQLDEREPLPLLSLGQLYAGGGDLQAARQAYQDAVRRAPGSLDARLALANTYLRSGEAAQAAPHLAAAALLDAAGPSSPHIDLVAGLAGAALSDTAAQGFIEGSQCTINGQRLLSIFMHPESWARYELRLPDLDAGEQLWLTFQVGLLPGSWDQDGDGVNFSAAIAGEQGEQALYSSYLDPGSDPSQRGWQPAALDLSAYAGQQVTLTLQTDGGPAGDLQFDWACWGSPRIVVQRPAQRVDTMENGAGRR